MRLQRNSSYGRFYKGYELKGDIKRLGASLFAISKWYGGSRAIDFYT